MSRYNDTNEVCLKKIHILVNACFSDQNSAVDSSDCTRMLGSCFNLHLVNKSSKKT
jgi:hypothetical protein